MKYSELVSTSIKSSEDYEEAFRLLSHEFTEHEETNLRFYDYVVLVKYNNRGVGVMTGMRHLPSKVIITDIVVDEQYRGHGVALKLFEMFTQKVKSDGFTYVMGITPPDNRSANSFYKKIGATNEMLQVNILDLNKGIPIINQKDMVLKEREKRREKE
jgi:ribosomal protein S18 acetylase RimI-like enzyme